MKKIVSIALLMAMLLSLCLFSLDASAVALAAEKDTAEETEDVLFFSCKYDAENKKITINGTMYHDAFALYSKATLVIYAIPQGKTENDVLNDPASKPIAETAVSINFAFTVKVKGINDIYSRYAVFLKLPEGKMILGTRAQYAEVASNGGTSQDKSCFKGISSSGSAVSSGIDADMTVIPVYLDMLYSDKASIFVYQYEHKQLFFDKVYVNEIDTRVATAFSSGAKIYFQFLVKNGKEFTDFQSASAEYYMPNVYDEKVLLLIHAATEFVAKRYNGDERGALSGIVVGKGLDTPSLYNANAIASTNEYVEMCGAYAIVIAMAARGISPSLDIVLPITGAKFTVGGESTHGELSANAFVEGVLDYFATTLEAGLDFTFLVETSVTPFGIANDNIEDGVDLEHINEGSDFYAGKQKGFSDYLDKLSSQYKGTPKNYILEWTPLNDLSGTALAAAYAYSYYALYGDERVSSFVINLFNDGADQSRINDLFHVMKYIDTPRSYYSTSALLKYFGCALWEELPGIAKSATNKTKLSYTVLPLSDVPNGVKGSFAYFDFSETTFLEGWHNGDGCSSIRVDYSSSGRKALRADLNALADGCRSEMVYNYEYRENMAHTPFIRFAFQISDMAENSLYEINVLLENSHARFESSYVAHGGDLDTLVMDLSEYTSFNAVESMKFSVRCLDGDVSAFTFWMYDITGYSEKYSSDELAELIKSERSKIYDEEEDVEKKDTFESFIVAFVILVILGVFGILAFVFFRRDNKSEEDKE